MAKVNSTQRLAVKLKCFFPTSFFQALNAIYTGGVIKSSVANLLYIFSYTSYGGREVLRCPWTPLLSPFKKLTYNILVAKTGKYSLFETVWSPPLKNRGYAPAVPGVHGARWWLKAKNDIDWVAYPIKISPLCRTPFIRWKPGVNWLCGISKTSTKLTASCCLQ